MPKAFRGISAGDGGFVLPRLHLMNTFDFQGTTLRTIEIDGAPWFPANDVCRCLGLSTYAGASQHLKSLAADERRLLCRKKPTARHSHNNPQIVSQGDGFEWAKGEAHISAISESGLYKLIMRANPSRPEVATFQDWVTREVLPAIRRTGGYLLNEHARETAHADTKEAMPMLLGLTRK
jgi:prophage antirepressor-like protein